MVRGRGGFWGLRREERREDAFFGGEWRGRERRLWGRKRERERVEILRKRERERESDKNGGGGE